MRIAVTVIALGLGLAAGVWLRLAFGGPRMRTQAHRRAFEERVAPPPEEAAPVHRLPRAGGSTSLDASGSPPAESDASVSAGRVTYGYYCEFCHGSEADGHGPVGRSYVPVPADLRTARIANMSDETLLREILTGEGHEPVLEYVIPPSRRPSIVAYVRSLGDRNGGGR